MVMMMIVYRISMNQMTTVLVGVMPFAWFYSHLYYTDTIATLALLAVYMYQKEGKISRAGIAGIVAVGMRQTNIVWLFGFSVLEVFVRNGTPKSVNEFLSRISKLWLQIFTGILFAIFLLYNKGSIVLGHHKYHNSSLHCAQINYFLLALGGLIWPIFFNKKFWKFFLSFSSTFVSLLSVLAAEYGTIAHPFVLSDNRHYSFYFFKRIVSSHRMVRSVIIPAVVTIVWNALRIGIENPLSGITKNAKAGRMVFIFCVLVTLVPTPLIEFRYYNLPIIFCLMEMVKLVNRRISLIMIATCVMVNIVTMYVFLFRPFVASDSTIGRFMY